MSRDCAKVAAAIMCHLCTHDWHGYSQGARWGDGEGTCTVEVDGETFEIEQGDRDCSSAVIDCWKAALHGTAYEGCLDGATYTGNMRDVFSGTGLFDIWDTASTSACIGDIYLNDANHTGMCVDDGSGELGYDAIGEFCISETGGVYGETGDQTGSEAYIHPYYDYPWNCTLHYNGGADGDSNTATNSNVPSNLPIPRYRAYIREQGWLDWMEGLRDTGGSSDDFAGVAGCWVYGFECENLGANGWIKCERADGSTDSGEIKDSPITGIIVYYDTPNPRETGYYRAKYRAHWLGSNPDWGKWEYDDEDGGAGKDVQSPIDMIQITLEK